MGLSHIVKLEGHEFDDLGQLMVGVKGFEPSTSSSRTQRATPALHPDVNRILIPWDCIRCPERRALPNHMPGSDLFDRA
jgi:hypothetical protein